MPQDTSVATEAPSPYDTPPVDGLRRFWMRIMTWVEDVPADLPFPCWTTSYSADYRLRPSKAADAVVRGFPANVDVLNDGGLTDEEIDEFYVSQKAVCMLLDATDEQTAWSIVETSFPDARRGYCEPADDTTLAQLGAGGRFVHAAAP